MYEQEYLEALAQGDDRRIAAIKIINNRRKYPFAIPPSTEDELVATFGGWVRNLPRYYD